MEKKRFYMTTAIDYVNQKPHLGTAYEKIGADCMARYKRLCGFETHFVMGNDDLVELESSSSQFQALHGLRFEMQGFNFVGYQYSLPFMGGLFEKPEVEIEEDLAALASQIDERTVLVSHSPVYGILDIVAMGGHAGSKSLKKVVELKNPLAHVHGHIHSCFGVSGRHFNVAAAWKRRAMVLDLESQRHEVVTEAVV